MAKPTWAELTREQRRWVLNILAEEIGWQERHAPAAKAPATASRIAALRAALAALPEVPR